MRRCKSCSLQLCAGDGACPATFSLCNKCSCVGHWVRRYCNSGPPVVTNTVMCTFTGPRSLQDIAHICIGLQYRHWSTGVHNRPQHHGKIGIMSKRPREGRTTSKSHRWWAHKDHGEHCVHSHCNHENSQHMHAICWWHKDTTIRTHWSEQRKARKVAIATFCQCSFCHRPVTFNWNGRPCSAY